MVVDLDRLPVFPPLQPSHVNAKKAMLLEWIESQCHDIKVQDIIKDCQDKIHQLTKGKKYNYMLHFTHRKRAPCRIIYTTREILFLFVEKLDSLVEDCIKVLEQGNNSRMIEISGINERLAALDQVIVAAKQHIVEQKGIAQVSIILAYLICGRKTKPSKYPESLLPASPVNGKIQ